MPLYTIIQSEQGDTFYLNEAYMSTLAFGSEEMAWTTEDLEKAELMLYRVISAHGYDDDLEFSIMELG